MNETLPENPFTHPIFWGRNKELRTIYWRLNSTVPQCCAIIGETFIGKTTLLQHLTESVHETILDDSRNTRTFTFMYIDCKLAVDTVDRDLGNYASAQFWWSLYLEACESLPCTHLPKLVAPMINAEQNELTSYAYEIKLALEELIHDYGKPVIFVLDNFEIVARLDVRNSEWLRALLRSNCAYIVASRHLLYLLYQYTQDNWANPSPLYNLFSDPIYLGLMDEQEVDTYLLQASEMANGLGSRWKKQDIDFIRTFCGRHAELIRIGCRHLFEFRLRFPQNGELSEDAFEDMFIEERIFNDARIICNQLWSSLADPELRDEPRIEEGSEEEYAHRLFPHQKSLIEIATGHVPTDKKILFALEQRGLIERANGKWRVFAEVMRQFILNREIFYIQAVQAEEKQQLSDRLQATNSQTTVTTERKEIADLTYLEGKVYSYLKSHVGEVCDREAIKRAVWQNNSPTNTALQKLIERIRVKIEPDPENPRYLIAIRGLGYMLREVPT